MSWSIEFVLYGEAKDGVSQNTITNELILKFDKHAITGVDYYKQEPRYCKIELFSSDWINNNLSTFLNGDGNSLNSDIYSGYWNHCARVKYNGTTKYIGYLKRENIQYDKKTDTYNLTFVDLWFVFDYWSSIKDKTGLGQTITFQNHLSNLFFSFKHSPWSQGGGSDPFEGYVSYDFNYEGGVPVEGLNIYDHDLDEQLINVDKHVGLTIDNWEWQPDNPYALPILGGGWVTSHATSWAGVNSDGKTTFTMMRYDQIFFPYGNLDYVEQEIWIKKITLEYNDIVLSSTLYHNTDTRSFESFDDAEKFVASKYLYDKDYIKEGYSLIPQLTITNGDDYYYFAMTSNEIRYTGIMNFYRLKLKQETIKMQDYVNLLMYLNNLTIVSNDVGDMTVINKLPISSASSNNILDDDIIEFKSIGILGKTPNFMSLTSIIDSVNNDEIGKALGTYYANLSNLIKQNVDIEILNNYDLNMLDVITVYGHDYSIYAILLDEDRFSYIIKMWSV